MCIYLRIINAKGVHQNGWSKYSRNNLSLKDEHIKTAKNFTKKDIEFKLDFLQHLGEKILYPVKIQVVKKRKYKNGNVTKTVKFEKVIKD